MLARWRKQTWMRRFWIVLGGVATLLLIFLYGFENLRGTIAMSNAKRYAAANGLPMDIGERMAVPPTDDEDNFEIYRRTIRELPELSELEPGFRSFRPHQDNRDLTEDRPPWSTGIARDLRFSTSPPAPTAEQAAGKILRMLDPFQEDLSEIAEVSTWEHWDFEYEWEGDIREVDLFHPGALYGMLSLRAYCRITLGKTDTAVSDLETLCRVFRLINERPLWFHAYNFRQFSDLMCETVWLGLENNAFSEDDLDRLIEAINNSGFRSFMVQAFVNEEAYALRYAEQNYFSAASRVAHRPHYAPNYWPDSLSPAFEWDDDLLESADRLTYICLPTGWFKLYQAHKTRRLVNVAKGSPSMRDMYQLFELYRQDDSLYRLIWRGSGFSNDYRNFGTSLVNAATKLELAVAAMRLERQFLTGGNYPESPASLQGPPIDPWSNLPLNIQTGKDGRGLIYSIGKDQADNGGTPLDSSGKGDLIWHFRISSLPPQSGSPQAPPTSRKAP